MKILVTGGAGFIGSHLVNSLVKKGHKVVVLDNLSTGKKNFLSGETKIYRLSLSSPKIFEVFKKERPRVVYYLAGPINLRRKIDNPLFGASLNFFNNFKRILDCSRLFKTKKFIFISSGGALYSGARVIPTPEDYPVCPGSLYGLANLILEKFLEEYYKNYGLNFIILRFSNIYGPRQWEQGVIPSFIISILKNKSLIINGDGKQTRDFIYIDDAVRALLIAAKTRKIGIFNVGSGRETNLNELFKKITEILNIQIKPNYCPAVEKGVQRSALDFSKIKKELSWQPNYSLDKGLKETINWFRNKN